MALQMSLSPQGDTMGSLMLSGTKEQVLFYEHGGDDSRP